MKLKDRLLKNTTSNISNLGLQEKSKNEFSISDIFIDSQETRDYIVELAQSRRNMILISEKSFDKFIIADYFKAQLRKTNVRTIGDIDSRMDDFHGRINIVPNPDIHNFVKILEQIIYGCQSFIVGVNLGSYNNIINKLKVLIALSYKNLSQTDILTLIGSMNPIVVYISKNADGLFFVSRVDEIKWNETNTDLVIDTLISNKPNSKSISKLKTLNQTAMNEGGSVLSFEQKSQENCDINPPQKPDVPDEQVSLQHKIDEAVYESNIKEQKVNKYQLLKEKARQKKLAEKQ